MWFVWFVLSFFICHTLFNIFLQSRYFYKFKGSKSGYTKTDVDPYSNRIIIVTIIYIVFLILVFAVGFIDTWASLVGNAVGFFTGYFHYMSILKESQNQKENDWNSLTDKEKMEIISTNINKAKEEMQNDGIDVDGALRELVNEVNNKTKKTNSINNVITYKTFSLPLNYQDCDWYFDLNEILVELIKDIILERKSVENNKVDYNGLLDIIREALKRISNFPEEEKQKIIARFSRYWESEMEFKYISFEMEISDFEQVFWKLEEVFENYASDDEFDALPDSLHKRAIINERLAERGDVEALLLHAKNIGWGFVFPQDLSGYDGYIDRLSSLAYKGNLEARFLLGTIYSLSDSEYASKAACYSFSLGVNLKDKRSLLSMNNIKFMGFNHSDFDDYNFYTPTHDFEKKIALCKEQKVIDKMDVTTHFKDLIRIGKPDFSNKTEGFLFCNNPPFALKPTKFITMVTSDINAYCEHLNDRGLKSKLNKSIGFGYSVKDPIGYKHISGIHILDDYFNFIIPNASGKWDLLEYFRVGSLENNVDKYLVSYKNEKGDALVYTLYFWMYDNSENAFPFFENIYRLPMGFIPKNDEIPIEYRYLEKTILNEEENLFGNEYYYSLLIGESQSVQEKDDY